VERWIKNLMEVERLWVLEMSEKKKCFYVDEYGRRV